ncbi:MAG: ABC transporter ATP-binding protein/permease [Spirochaetia bacterium]|nr:ABC transporter ATP-binding protein/permease [Spirochaetia bacterium]
METSVSNPPSTWKLTARLLSYVFHYRTRVFLGLLFSFLVSLANLFSITALVPIFNAIGETGPIELFQIGQEDRDRQTQFEQMASPAYFDRIQAAVYSGKQWANAQVHGKSSREVVITLCAIILPVYLLKLLCLTIAFYCIGTAGLMAVRDLRMELYGKLNELGLSHFTENQTGFIMSRIINDAESVGRNLSAEFQEGIVDLLYIVTHLAFLAIISWKMLALAIIAIPILSSPVAKFARKIRGAAKGQQERLAELGAHIHEVLSGIRVIRAFSMQRFESGRFQVANQRLYQNTFRGHYYHQVGPALTEMVATVAVVGFLSWAAYEIYKDHITRGQFFAFAFALIFLMRPIKQVSILVNLTSAAMSAGQRIFELLDTPAAIAEKPNPIKLRTFEDQIVYRNVSFTYPGTERSVLNGIDLTVKKGETVSFVGASGAGKSTLMDLLPRFFDVDGGAITIDGHDVRDFALRDLRTAIGIVTQNIFLFHTSIKENISYGRLDIPMERIIEVAKAANAHDFISELPQGYETSVGEYGVMLSGGQKQRIAIARAILLDPPILIFDEATSALDNESEKLVHEAMERLLLGRTVFIIAHRLSSVYRSNQIFVLNEGRIVERGTHEDLLAGGEVYRKLYEMQFQE